MASLQELLAEEGFDDYGSKKKVKSRDKRSRDARSFEAQLQKCRHNVPLNSFSVVYPRRRASLDSGKSFSGATEMGFSKTHEPPIDEVAVRAVVSILSGYVGQYLKDEKFRQSVRAKCYACFLRKDKDLDNGVLANLEMEIENIERLVETGGTKEETRLKSLEYSIRLLSLAAALNSRTTKNGSTCGIPNSHLSACAQLYLSIVYKLEKNDRISARHLLQVFCDAPSIARIHVLPQLWDHLFLPHLLHLKIWQAEELQSIENSGSLDKETRINALSEAYNAHMDVGTVKFALYYKEWLKVGVQGPAVPAVPLPATMDPGHLRRFSDSSSAHSSSNEFLYRAVFGTIPEDYPTELNSTDEYLSCHSCLEDKEMLSPHKDTAKLYSYSSVEQQKTRTRRRSSSSLIEKKIISAELWPNSEEIDRFRFLNCRSDLKKCTVEVATAALVQRNRMRRNDLDGAVHTICTSDSISECEMAIRMMTKTWLDSNGDTLVESELSKVPVVEGILDVLSASIDDEILELAISLLAQIVANNELCANIILNFDPQLDIFVRLLRNSNLFLKAAALLHLVKPKAKQMVTMEWIPLVLRVLEFGNQLQTLFTIQCSPQVAAYYFLDELLLCFDEEKNKENARHLVSLGGPNLLLRRLEAGDMREKNKAASMIHCCIMADGNCRHYVAKNLKKQSLISLLVVKNEIMPQALPFALLTELFCLSRHHLRIQFLIELKNGWDSFNTMQVVLAYLQRAQPEECPVVAAILLQLDLLGDPCECSVYRDEVIDKMVEALNVKVISETVQQQSARALLILGGHFSYLGEPAAEKWLLKQAGFDESSQSSFANNHVNKEENESETQWLGKTATALLKKDSKRLFGALSDSIANGIPSLVRASLVTVAWIGMFLIPIGGRNLQSLACSILVPQLLESLNYDRSMEERTIASFSLLNLLKGSDYLRRLSTSNQEVLDHLHGLSEVTWTARELISMITRSKRDRHLHNDSSDLPK